MSKCMSVVSGQHLINHAQQRERERAYVSIRQMLRAAPHKSCAIERERESIRQPMSDAEGAYVSIRQMLRAASHNACPIVREREHTLAYGRC
jgi:DNA repair exonuclease SbcCD ATPase subunit